MNMKDILFDPRLINQFMLLLDHFVLVQKL